jgi:glycosyltransferase involved in cell wall biosynthesis
MRVGIFFFRPSLGGGTTTFVAHLFKALDAAGQRPIILKVKERGEDFTRPFGKYDGVTYQNVTVPEARQFVRSHPTVMGAPAGVKYLIEPTIIADLMKLGMRIVIHDPNEFSIYDHLSTRKDLRAAKLPTRPICIRPTMQKFYPKAVWIPHPYMRHFDDEAVFVGHRIQHAISVARIASVKRPRIILDANRLLPKRKRVKLLGAEYRMYTYNLAKKYPEFKQSGKTFQFPMTFAAAPELCHNALFNVDMTWFPDDGGGTQYAQLEAMDAGCVNIMNEDWFRYKGEVKPDKHIISVRDAKELAATLHGDYLIGMSQIRENSFKLLKKHAPKLVGQLYMEELLR